MDYTMAQAKRDFKRGFVRGASLVAPLPSEGGWWVLINDNGMFGGPLVDARSGEIRFFKTTDAAISALHQIGFSLAVSFVVGVSL